MRTRTFLGLILLVAALIVASTPALLGPASTGVEKLAAEAGVIEDTKALEAKQKKAAAKEKSTQDPVDSTLALKGFVIEKDDDLRDTMPVGERDTNERGRLEAGNRRVLLPGQKPGTDAYSPPFAAEDGVLLDIDGCPVFRPEADVAAMMADADIKKIYQGKVATADDVAACRKVFADRVAITTSAEDADELPGDRRHYASMIRTDSERMYLEMLRISTFADLLGTTNDERQSMIRDLRGEPADDADAASSK